VESDTISDIQDDIQEDVFTDAGEDAGTDVLDDVSTDVSEDTGNDVTMNVFIPSVYDMAAGTVKAGDYTVKAITGTSARTVIDAKDVKNYSTKKSK